MLIIVERLQSLNDTVAKFNHTQNQISHFQNLGPSTIHIIACLTKY